jgi:hypothetical protein
MKLLDQKKENEKKTGKKGSSEKQYVVRGKQVSESSIQRFERRAKKRGILPAEGGGDDAGTDAGYDSQFDEWTGVDYGQQGGYVDPTGGGAAAAAVAGYSHGGYVTSDHAQYAGQGYYDAGGSAAQQQHQQQSGYGYGSGYAGEQTVDLGGWVYGR